MSERRDLRRDAAGRLVTGAMPEGKAAAARSTIEAAGFSIDVVDEVNWRVGPYLYRPASELWTGPGGQGYGTRTLIERLKAGGAR